MLTDSIWVWLVRTTVLSALVLAVGATAVRFIRTPADRLRLIQWIFVACLLTPLLPMTSNWRTLSLDLIPRIEAVTVAPLDQDLSVVLSRNMERAPVDRLETPAQPSGEVASSAPVERRPQTRIQPGASAQAVEPAPALPTRGPQSPNRSARTSSFSIADFTIVTYLIAVGGMVVWGAMGLLRRRVIRCSGRAAPLPVLAAFDQIAGRAGARVRILVSDRVDAPLTWGSIRPIIILPATFVEPSQQVELQWSLRHEWSHVKNCDSASLQLANAVQILFFYQPLFWILRRRMILSQDLIADAMAIPHVDRAADYADFLIRLAGTRLRHRVPHTLGIVERKSQLFHRVKMLIDVRANVRPDCRRRTTILASLGSLALLGLLSTIQLDASDKPPIQAPVASPASVAVQEEAPQSINEVNPPAADVKSDESSPGVVSGQLINSADGQPVPDAKVLLRSGGRKIATSDSTGRFRFEGVPDDTGGYELWAYRDNLITQKVLVPSMPSDGSSPARYKPLRLEMTPGRQARFLVLSNGKPISGATVRFGYPDRRAPVTDEAGSVVVKGLLPQLYDVTVEASGYARSPQQLDLNATSSDDEYRVSLHQGGAVEGIVIDGDGQPLAGANVVYRHAGGSVGFYGDSPTSDEQGKFRHQFLPLNTAIEISVDKDGYIAAKQEFSLTSEQSSKELRFTLSPRPKGPTVAGRIQDKNGKPISGARITNEGNGADGARRTITGPQGDFELDDLQEFNGFQIRIAAKGFAPQFIPVEFESDNMREKLLVTLEPGHAIHGKVLDEQERPVVGAYVMARSHVYWVGFESIRTDVAGAFAFDSLPADAQFQVSATGYPTTSAVPLTLDGPEPVSIVLKTPGVIRGQVVDAATQQPLPQFRIRAGFSRSRLPGDAKASYRHELSDPGITVRSQDGRFTLDQMVPGAPLELIVDADGYEQVVIPRAVGAKDSEATSISVAMTPKVAQKPYSVTVQFLDHHDQPVPNAQLRLIVSKTQPTGRGDNAYNWALLKSGQLGQKSYVEQYLSGTTNSEGRFEFQTVVPGRYLQLAYWGKGVPEGRSLAFDESRPGESDLVTIKLPAPAILRGKLDRGNLKDADSIKVMRQDEAFQQFEVKLDKEQTTFEFAELPPGSYSIGVYSKPVPVTENGAQMFRTSPIAGQRISIKAGEIKEVEFLDRQEKP